MLKEFKIPHRSDQMHYRIGKDMPFVPYTEDMRKMDKLKAKMIREDTSYLFQKSPVEETVEVVSSTEEGEAQMMQDCCKYYDNLVPFSCRHRHIDKWDLLWQCSVCGQWYKIDFDTSTMTPRIKNVQEVDPSMYFDSIEHERLDIFQIRNIQSGVPILEPDRQAVANFEVTKKHNWMCPNCTYAPEVTLSDEGNIFTCRDCGNVYKLWTNQDTKMVSYINLNKPKSVSPVIVETPMEEDTSHMENIEEPVVSEISESQEEIVQDTVVEETTVTETTEEITPTIVDGKVMAPSLVSEDSIVDYPNVIKPHTVSDTAQMEEIYDHIRESSKDFKITTVADTESKEETSPEWSEDIIDEMMDTGELPEAFTAPCAEDIPDDNYLKEDKEPDTTTIQEEGVLVAKGIPDWMCDSCLSDYKDVTLVDFDNAPAYQCNTCDVIYYIERVGEEQDIVFKQFKQITPEEMSSMYVTTDTISKIVDETEEGGVLDTIMDKVMEDVFSSEMAPVKWEREDIGEDIDPKDFKSIDDVEEQTAPVITEEISLDIEDDVPIVVDKISIDTPVVEEIKSDNYLHVTPDPVHVPSKIAMDEAIFSNEDIDPDFSINEEEMEHYYRTQVVQEDMIAQHDIDTVDTYRIQVNLPKGIENVVMTHDQISKGPLGQMIREQKAEDDFSLDIEETKDYSTFDALRKVANDWELPSGIQNMPVDDPTIKEMSNDAMASIFNKKEPYVTTVIPGTVEDSTKFHTVKSSICDRSDNRIHKQEEYHTLDFIVNNESKRLGGMVKIYNNDVYTFKVESFSVRMLSAPDDVFDAPKTHSLDIADPLAGELGSWDAMVYELKLISGENFYVYVDMAMLSRVTVGFK